MFCQKCGTQIPDDAVFCSSCGASITAPNSTKTTPTNPVKDQASKPVLICAFGILAAFFMPWVQLLGAGLSGYNLGNLGSYGNYAWAIPILAGATILLSFSGVNNRGIGALTGIVPLGGLAYALVQLINESGAEGGFEPALKMAQQVFSIGIYVTLIFSVAIIIAAGRPATATAPNPTPEA